MGEKNFGIDLYMYIQMWNYKIAMTMLVAKFSIQ